MSCCQFFSTKASKCCFSVQKTFASWEFFWQKKNLALRNFFQKLLPSWNILPSSESDETLKLLNFGVLSEPLTGLLNFLITWLSRFGANCLSAHFQKRAPGLIVLKRSLSCLTALPCLGLVRVRFLLCRMHFYGKLPSLVCISKIRYLYRYLARDASSVRVCLKNFQS